jgi:uncharacterized protein (TIGR03083 family)
MPDPLSTLRSSTEHLRRIVEDLPGRQLDAPAYPSDWSIADVLSHVGSGGVILQRRLEDALAARETAPEFSETVWEEWNAKSSLAKRSDALVADRELVERLESVSDEERRGFRFTMGPLSEDFDGFVGLRLNEHSLHTWDIEVTLEPNTTLSSEATSYIIDRLQLITRFTGKPSQLDGPVAVRTTDPRRDFTLTPGSEALSLGPSGPATRPDIELPAEAFVRLVYGRLDPGHTPVPEGRDLLVTLRRAFPGP